MKVCVIFIVLMVFQAITCEKAVSKLLRKLVVPKMNEKCKKIKCATVDDPHCVRMRRHDLSLTIHIIATNKCELDYMKCHDDVEAKIVPMKYCSHNVDETSGKKKNKPAHIRVKRRVKGVIKPIQRLADTDKSNTTQQPRTGYKDNNNKIKHLKLKKSRINSNKLSLQWKNDEDSNVISKDNDNRSTMKDHGHGAGHHVRQALGDPFSSELDSDLENDERKKIIKGLMGNRPQWLSQAIEIIDLGNPTQELGTEFPMLSGEADNFSKESLIEADKEQYEERCPTVCPSRDVMVCGRCQHGIYKTFRSVCHLRMFQCSYEAETMELVARYPCVLSAPYVSDSRTELKGRITEPGDDDKVLRFIMCRNQHKLGTDEKPPEDPRCNFRQTKEKLKYYDFKGIDLLLPSHLIHIKESSEY